VDVDDDGDASDFDFATILSLCNAQFLLPSWRLLLVVVGGGVGMNSGRTELNDMLMLLFTKPNFCPTPPKILFWF